MAGVMMAHMVYISTVMNLTVMKVTVTVVVKQKVVLTV